MKTLILLSLASIMWSTNALADRIVVRDYLATRYPDMPPAGAHRYEVEDGSTLVSVSVCVHHLHQGAFYGCQNLTTVSLPDGVVDIGQGSFYGCSRLSCVRLSPNLTSIGEGSFRDCASLTDICLPSGCKAIGKYAFRGCESLTNVSWGVCEDIGESAFSGCTALPQAEIPDSVTNIEQRAFSGCISLERVHFPLQLKEIGASAFADCSSLADIMLPDGVQKLASSVFRDCWHGHGNTTRFQWRVDQYGWLAKYGLTNTRSPEETASASLGKRDAVGSEMFVWQDFVAGTDPTNENSRFLATITFENGLPIVGGNPKFAQPADEALRAYTIWGVITAQISVTLCLCV